ncbi:hypothetical protein ACMX2H_11480 [Arthrobacter sulfonylureivorans]|uniref:hypothetical protein n=1 Tax=Arthrobacter sulfonylureivorans TaxID=2486855 RepID=UPI0039E344D4
MTTEAGQGTVALVETKLTFRPPGPEVGAKEFFLTLRGLLLGGCPDLKLGYPIVFRTEDGGATPCLDVPTAVAIPAGHEAHDAVRTQSAAWEEALKGEPDLDRFNAANTSINEVVASFAEASAAAAGFAVKASSSFSMVWWDADAGDFQSSQLSKPQAA